MKIHEKVTQDRVLEAVQRAMFGTDNPGFCMACGADHDECEPDARNYECHECGKREAYGAELILLYIA